MSNVLPVGCQRLSLSRVRQFQLFTLLLVGTQQEYSSCDTQAVGRIRRYGQHRKVQLYRFLVSNTIDEEIFKSRRAHDAEELLKTASKPETAGPL